MDNSPVDPTKNAAYIAALKEDHPTNHQQRVAAKYFVLGYEEARKAGNEVPDDVRDLLREEAEAES